MNKEFIKINQGRLTCYSISLTLEELINNTTVEYYNSKTGKGYQRPLIPSHFKKIADYLASDNPVLPTSILTAVDPNQLKEFIDIFNQTDKVQPSDAPKNNTINITGKLRVVDGQHRIEGIRHLARYNPEAYEKIKKYTFPSLIMLIPEDQEIYEISAFININKAGKPVSTDLAIELRDKIRRNMELTLHEVFETTALILAKKLNYNEGSVWFNLIKFGDETSVGKSISINAFQKSLIPLIRNYYQSSYRDIKTYGETDILVNELYPLIFEGWNIVKQNWPECFISEGANSIRKFNIQKGIGVFSIHIVLTGLMEKYIKEGNKREIIIQDTLNDFQKILDHSLLKSDDWRVGGRFSANNSQSGFNQIANIILNKEVQSDF